MKKLIASAVSLSLGSGLLLLAGCNQDADLGKPALPVTQNKHLKVITFESDSFGYRINLDSVSAQWFQKFAVENGRLLEVHCPEQNVQIKINGKDFRTYFRDHIGQLMVEDQPVSPNSKQQIAFKIVTEAEGVEIRIDLPISKNSFGFHIKSNHRCKVEVIGNEQSDTNFIKELNPQEKLEFHIGSGQSFDKQNPIPIIVEPIKIDGPCRRPNGHQCLCLSFATSQTAFPVRTYFPSVQRPLLLGCRYLDFPVSCPHQSNCRDLYSKIQTRYF